jgi:6-phosphofructokinase
MKRMTIRRVGIVFSGGPAPAANAVIAAAGVSFLDSGREVVGFYHGYSELQEYHPVSHRLLPDVHYRVFADDDLRGIRNARGVILGTSRAGPGREIRSVADLDDPARVAGLQTVYAALVDLQVDAWISIGGDGTLRTANLLHRYQARLPAGARRIPVVHVPKTIDNDYPGIDFTFGYFTAVDVMARSLHNLRADAEATSSWFVVETMGRRAGWLAYGVGIAGESDLTIGVEDVGPDWMRGGRLDLTRLADRIVDVIIARERRGKHHGVVVVAEGLAELLPEEALRGGGNDERGRLSLATVDLARVISAAVAERHAARAGRKKKVTGVQLGYEARSAAPQAFDVALGSQLGIGAYRALVEEGLDGHLVSVTGQLDLRYVPFAELVHPETLSTEVRLVRPGSDFHQLARFLEARLDRPAGWGPRSARTER